MTRNERLLRCIDAATAALAVERLDTDLYPIGGNEPLQYRVGAGRELSPPGGEALADPGRLRPLPAPGPDAPSLTSAGLPAPRVASPGGAARR